MELSVEQGKKQRINSIDIFRVIATFFVVVLHVPFPGVIGEYIAVYARIAVPFFFCVSGFFIYDSNENKVKQRCKKQIILFVKIMLIVDIIYSAWYLLVEGWEYVWSGLSSLGFILFNFTIGGHMWFLRALIYTMLLLLIIPVKKCEKLIFFSLPLIVIINLVCCKYSLLLFGFSFPQKIYEPISKFVGVAFVYFFCGYFIRRCYLEGKFNNIHKKSIVMLMSVFILTNGVEYMFLDYFHFNVPVCDYISTFFLVISIFILLLLCPLQEKDNMLITIGKKYCLYIYIFHLIVAKILNKVLNIFNVGDWFDWIKPLVVFLLSLVLAFMISVFLSLFKSNEGLRHDKVIR